MAEQEKLLEYSDIAKATGSTLDRVRGWKKRGHLPEPSVEIGNRPAWEEHIIHPVITRVLETGTPRTDGRYRYPAPRVVQD